MPKKKEDSALLIGCSKNKWGEEKYFCNHSEVKKTIYATIPKQ